MNEAYKLLEVNGDITDLNFANKLFKYQNEMIEQERIETRELKEQFKSLMEDTNRVAVKVEKERRKKKLISLMPRRVPV